MNAKLVSALAATVVLVPGASAIAQEADAQDAAAKSAARNAVTELESCWVMQTTYKGCKIEPLPGSGLEAVTVTRATRKTYVVTAASRSGAKFRIARRPKAKFKRTCTPAGTGGCPAGGKW